MSTAASSSGRLCCGFIFTYFYPKCLYNKNMATYTLPEIDWQEIARLVLRSRALDELEEGTLTPQKKVKYQFSAKGHELAQVLLGWHLNHPHDGATVYYRSRPLMMTLGLSLREALASSLARSGSITEGRDVGVMFALPPRRGATVLPASGDVGAQYSPAAGWAQAIRYRSQTLGEADWQGALAVACGGEGSAAANGFWAALNIATTRNVPLLFFIEDNRFAISVRSQRQYPGGDLTANLASYGNLKIFTGDGTDPAQAAEVIRAAVTYVRKAQSPALLRLQVVRLMGHTFIDNQAYKTAAEREAEARRDPLRQLQDFLPHLDWPALQREVTTELQEALSEAEAQPEPDPKQAARHLFYEVPQQVGGLLPEIRQGVLLPMPAGSQEPRPASPQRVGLVEAVRRVLTEEMSLNPRILVFGEDVGRKGGVHGATAHLQKRFGEARVFDTSLNEDGIMGSATGMALAGLLPVPEIQFRKYADPATEQINDNGTMRWRMAGKFAAPVVLRMPVGFARTTGDPWHSVTAEAVYAHTLGWKLAFPSNAEDAAGLMRAALRGNDPVIFFEHRALLDAAEARCPYPGPDYLLPFGRATYRLRGAGLTVVTWGAMVYRCLQAAEAWPGEIDLLDLRTIVPWDQERVMDSVRRTGKLLVVHEDTRTGGFAAEIMAAVTEEAFEYLDGPPRRLTTADCMIPYNAALMDAVVPTVDAIRRAMGDLLAY